MFAAHELKGPEIRNTVRTAHTWATGCKQLLTTQHVLSVVKNMLEQNMKGYSLDFSFSSKKCLSL
jgi:hypothetical protein